MNTQLTTKLQQNQPKMAIKAFLITIIMATMAIQAFSTDYIVGDDFGWKLGVNYTQWAQGKNFYLGDRLVFKYPVGAHNVYKVNGTAFQDCAKPLSSSEALTSGNDVVTLETPGKKWYVCGVGSHCSSGMKLVITVSSTEAPASAPDPSNGTSAANHVSCSGTCACMIIAAFAFLKLVWA